MTNHDLSEYATADFPEVRGAVTTLRFRWGTVVVQLDVAAIPPPLALLAPRTDVKALLGRCDVRIMRDEPSMSRRQVQVELIQAGDTLRWRDADGPERERRDFVLSPAGDDDEFARARRAATGEYWPEAGAMVSFTMDKGKATGFEVRSEDGGTAERGARRGR